MASYYDYVLLVIPLLMSGGLALGTLAEVPTHPLILISGMLAILVIGHAMFVRAPITPPHTPMLSKPSEETQPDTHLDD